jgi:hypothetical protein
MSFAIQVMSSTLPLYAGIDSSLEATDSELHDLDELLIGEA